MEKIILDTETTGLADPALVDLAFLDEQGYKTSLRCRPRKPIELGATMVNHITNEMVEENAPFADMDRYVELKERIESSIVIAHHAPYDIGVLKNEGINVRYYLDTKEIAQSMYPTAENHKLQGLRYILKLNVKAEAHSADGDVDILAALWKRMCTDSDEQAIVDRFMRSIPQD